jgi:hypothetical protein
MFLRGLWACVSDNFRGYWKEGKGHRLTEPPNLAYTDLRTHKHTTSADPNVFGRRSLPIAVQVFLAIVQVGIEDRSRVAVLVLVAEGGDGAGREGEGKRG